MSEPSPEPQERTFLVVVDNTEELHVALRFASLRAKKTGGRVALLARYETLAPGDIIFTGTPEGETVVEKGDRLEGEIEGIGRLSVTIT